MGETETSGDAVRPELATPTDGELLMRFRRSREEDAFRTLIKRHERLVLGVCLSVLGNMHDAEDAFQATFLILVRRADKVERYPSAAGWLFRVALRTAKRARLARQKREGVTPMPEPITEENVLSRIHDREQALSLHEELERLPEKYRVPLVLCYMEGKTRRQVATELDTTTHAIKARLARARKKLRLNLARRGVAFSVSMAAASASVTGAAECSSTLCSRTVDAGMSYAFHTGTERVESELVQTLAKEGLRQMTISSVGKVALALLFVFAVSGGMLVSFDSRLNLYAQGEDSQTILSLAAIEHTESVEPVAVSVGGSTSAATDAPENADKPTVLDDAVQALIAALKDSEATVRHSAAKALAEAGRGSREATQALIESIRQRDDNELAAIALKSVSATATGDAMREDASRGLFQILEADRETPKFRKAVVQTIGQIGGDAGIRAATFALRDNDTEVRAAAAEALALIVHLKRRRSFSSGFAAQRVPNQK